MFDLMYGFTKSFGALGFFLTAVAIAFIPIKVAARMFETERSDWISCTLVSFLMIVATQGFVFSIGLHAAFGILFVQIVIVSVILGADVFAAVLISLVTGFVTTGFFVLLHYVMVYFT